MNVNLPLFFLISTFFLINLLITVEAGGIRCSENATFQESGYDCQTCTQINAGIKVKCAEIHKKNCYCLSGYVKRDSDDRNCIAVEDCSTVESATSECGENEVRKSQGFDCQTCSNYQYVRCALIEEQRCYCRDGYVRRDDNKKCTKINQCPQEGG